MARVISSLPTVIALVAADLREQQPEAHPALGDRPVLGSERLLVLGGVLRVQLAGRLVGLDPLPDLGELALDHAFRDRKVGALGQSVEQLALQPHPAELVVFALHALGNRLAHLVEALEAELLGQLVIERRDQRAAQLLRRDLELRLFAGQLRRVIRLGERDGDGAGVARAHARPSARRSPG